MAVVLVHLVAVASLPCNEDFPHCRSITKICLFTRSFLLIGSLTLLVFGLEPSLCWLCDQVTLKRQAFVPSLSSTEYRKEKTFLEVA